MAGGYISDRGAYYVCPTCGKRFYILEPDMWVYKMTPMVSKGKQQLFYFCKYTHMKQYQEQYDAILKDRRHQAAALRNKKKKSERKELEKVLAGKRCAECRYCMKSKFGFYDCSVSCYSVGLMKAACYKFKPKEGTVNDGERSQEHLSKSQAVI